MADEKKEKQESKALVPMKDGALAPTDLEGMWRLATIMASSGMFGSEYNGKPEKMFVAMQMGCEVGLSITQAPQNIAVVNGKPSIYGDATIALIRNHLESDREYFIDDGKEIENYIGPEDLSKWPRELTAVCEMTRKSGGTYKGYFSVADAIRMGKWNRPTERGNKSVWQKHPKDMLMWKARHKVMNRGFSDILKGLVPVEISMDYDSDMEPAPDGSYEVKQDAQTKDISKYEQAAKILEIEDVECFVSYVDSIAEETGMDADSVIKSALKSPDIFVDSFHALNQPKKDVKEPDPEPDPEKSPEEPGQEPDKPDKVDGIFQDILAFHAKYADTHEDGFVNESTSDDMLAYIEYVAQATERSKQDVMERAVASDDFYKYFHTWLAKKGPLQEEPPAKVNTPKKTAYSDFVKEFMNLSAPRFSMFLGQNQSRIARCSDEDWEIITKKWDRLVSQGKLQGDEFPVQRESNDEMPGNNARQRLANLQKMYPNEWEKARLELKFGKTISTDEAAIKWESRIHEIIEGK